MPWAIFGLDKRIGTAKKENARWGGQLVPISGHLSACVPLELCYIAGQCPTGGSRPPGPLQAEPDYQQESQGQLAIVCQVLFVQLSGLVVRSHPALLPAGLDRWPWLEASRQAQQECRGPRVPLGSKPGLLYSPPAVVLLLAPSLPASSSCMGRFSRGHLSWSSSRSSRARPTSCTHPCGPAHWRVDTRLASPRPGLSASLGPDVHASLRAAGPRGVPRGLHPGLEHFHRSPDQRHDWSPRFGCVPGPSVDLRCPGRDSRIELQVLCSRPPIRSQAQVSWCSASSSPSTLPSIRI